MTQQSQVTLHSQVTIQTLELQLERLGDLSSGNAGLLVFVAGMEHPEYLP
jgi:hypothetical protein